jgi:hypothetical protein
LITLPQIIEELNLENGSNYKISVLKKYQDRKDLQRLLKMTSDTVAFTYGITMRNISEYVCESNRPIGLENALDILENEFVTREVTGNAAIERLHYVLGCLSSENADLLEKVIKRDLRINLGRTQINKVFKGLITKPAYMRCGIYSVDKEVDGKLKKGTARDISFPALVQLKADGTYREFHIHNGKVECNSRSGESYEYPVIFEQMKDRPDGHYTGELTVRGTKDRAEGNGLINSDNPPHDDIVVELWDYITEDEYKQAALKDKKNPCKIPYIDRWNKLTELVEDIQSDNVKLIPSLIVNSLEEATEQTSVWMREGHEGSILKDFSGVFKDGTSKHQLKLKVAFSVDVRITGFLEGTPGTKREKTFGGITYQTDDGLIKGSTSGFTDVQLDDFNSRREELIGTVMELEANDLTKGRNNDYWALSHPRFIELRGDKDTTDDLRRAQESLELAKLFKDR